MSIAEIIILVACIAGAGWGAWKGLIGQAGSLIGIVLGVVICQMFGVQVAARLGMDLFWSNILLFLFVYIVSVILAHLLKQTAHALQLGPIDRLAGAVLGIFKVLVLISLLLNIWLIIDPSSPVATGRLGSRIVGLLPRILDSAATYLHV